MGSLCIDGCDGLDQVSGDGGPVHGQDDHDQSGHLGAGLPPLQAVLLHAALWRVDAGHPGWLLLSVDPSAGDFVLILGTCVCVCVERPVPHTGRPAAALLEVVDAADPLHAGTGPRPAA